MKKVLFLATLLAVIAVITVVNAQQPRFTWMGANYAYDYLLNEKVDVGSARQFQDYYIANEAQRAKDAYDKDHKCHPIHLFVMGYLDCYGRQIKPFPWWCHYVPVVYAPVQTTGTTNTTTTNTGTTTGGTKLDATCYFLDITTKETIVMQGTVQGGVFSPETMKSGDLWASVAGADATIFQNLSFCGGWVTSSSGSKKWYPAIAQDKGGYWVCDRYQYLKKDFLPSPTQVEGVFHSVAAN